MNPARITLTIVKGRFEGKQYAFENSTRCIIGRADDCDIQLPADMEHADVSRHHCALEIDPPAVCLRDLESLNGTYVNGRKIGQRHPPPTGDTRPLNRFTTHELKHGDEVRIGHTILRVDVQESAHIPEEEYVPAYVV